MKSEVNLFPKKIKKIRQKQKLKRLSLRVVLIILLVLALTMIGMSSYSLKLAKENSELEAKASSLKSKIESLSDIESKQVYLISKLGSFESLLVTHEKHQAVTETVFGLIPNGTSLKGFDVSEEGVINLAGSVPNFVTLERLMEKIRNNQAYRLPILTAKVNRITLGQDGTVSFDIDLTMGAKQS